MRDASLDVASSVLRAISYVNLEQALVLPAAPRLVSVRVRDSFNASSEAAVEAAVHLVSVNDAPLLNASRAVFAKHEVEDGTGVTFDLLPAFVDAEDRPDFGGASAVQRMPGAMEVVTPPPYGNLTVGSSGAVLRFVPAAEDYGTRTFVVRACDTEGLCSDNVTLTVDIAAVNDAPAQRASVLTYDVVEDTVTRIPKCAERDGR